MGGTSHTDLEGASQSPPSPQNQLRSQLKTHRPAPKPTSEANAKAAAPAPERHVSWSPKWIVASPHRPRPPCPTGTIGEPTTVVIRSPAPRLIPNPCPAVIRLINPVAVPIRSPVIRLVRNPHVAVIWNVLPSAVRVQILRSGVATVGVTPGVRVANDVITIAIPAVPIVAIGG